MFELDDIEKKDESLTLNKDGSPNLNKLKTLKTLCDNTLVTSEYYDIHSKIVIPSIVKAFPNLIANEILGVQPAKYDPMQENIGGRLHTLRVIYQQEPKIETKEQLSPFQIAEYYNGKETVPSNGPSRLSIQILAKVVEYTKKSYSTSWSKQFVGENEINYFSNSIIDEIDAEHLKTLRNIINPPTDIFDMDKIDGNFTFSGDVHAALTCFINRQCSFIAARTRRGAGNWIIVSPTALTILQSATTSAFSRVDSNDELVEWKNAKPYNTCGIKYVGKLNHSIKVYVDQYADDRTPILIGYKGNEIDAAAFYSPRQFLTLDTSINDGYYRFERTDGLLPLENEPNSLGNAADYLSSVGINVDTLRFV